MAHYSEDNQHSDGRDSEASYTPKNKSTVPTAKEVGEGFTPGKWRFNSMPLPSRKVISIIAEGKTIAEVNQIVKGKIYTENDDKEAKANAALIASAPTLHADNKALREENAKFKKDDEIATSLLKEYEKENEELREALEGAREVMLHFKESPDWSEEHDEAYIKLREALS